MSAPAAEPAVAGPERGVVPGRREIVRSERVGWATPNAPWAMDAEAVARALDVDPGAGLSDEDARDRRGVAGSNELRRIGKRTAGAILRAQLRSAIVWLLVVASGVSFAFGEVAEALAIAGVVVLNTTLGFFTELRASRSMEALRALGSVRTTVRRDGVPLQVDAADLVPGDLVLIDAGDVVTADARLLSCSGMQADESALTGESMPVDKVPTVLSEGVPLAERSNMLFKGTTVTRGRAEAVVVTTGEATEVGHIGTLVEEAAEGDTPLERRIEVLGRQLMGVSLVLAIAATGLGALRGLDPLLMVQSAIALAVATVPEGLPVVATLALARGMWRLASRHVLVENLGAVETLGSTQLILTDKTGTLTENRMSVSTLVVDQKSLDVRSPGDVPASLPHLLQVIAAAGGDGSASEPMEVALLAAAEALGVEPAQVVAQCPLESLIAFDAAQKMSASKHRRGEGWWFAVKGAPEAVLDRATHIREGESVRELTPVDRTAWLECNERSARAGLRVLALAERSAAREDVSGPYAEGLTFLGLAGLVDPPRASVRPAIERARGAGVRVVMLTGDQAATASAIARHVGLADEPVTVEGSVLDGPDAAQALQADVVARATPEQKLRLLRSHQQSGMVVAMLGDGVNDAPALRQADIGVAMGKRGTAVARQAADMVLEDDDLGSVVVAIERGRVIFGNLRAFVVYLLGCNLAELLSIAVAAAVGLPLPLLPLQILYLNLLTDVFPAAALGAGEGDAGVMSQPPRPVGEPFLTRKHWGAITVHGAVITAAVLAAFSLSRHLGYSLGQQTTIAFASLGFAQLLHVFDMADPLGSPLRNAVTRNGWVWGALVLCTGLLVAGVTAPGLSALLGAEALDGRA